jgi:hypothetical protein
MMIQTARAFMVRTLLTAAVILGSASVVAALLRQVKMIFSLVIGGALAGLSFIVLVVVVSNALGRQGRSGWGVAVLGLIKMGLLGALLWWLLTRGHVHPLAFLAGFSTMVAALLIQGLRTWNSSLS